MPEGTLLDGLMPHYDVAERHRTIVRATPHAIYAAIRKADLGGGAITRTLLGIRLFPAVAVALMRSPTSAWSELRTRFATRGVGVRLAGFERTGFCVIAERAPEELVLGLLGKFWTLRGGLCPAVNETDFRSGPAPGMALAGWNFLVREQRPGVCELTTETRVWCAPDARHRFRLYWLLVRPGSGLIRREMLRAIRQQAQAT